MGIATLFSFLLQHGAELFSSIEIEVRVELRSRDRKGTKLGIEKTEKVYRSGYHGSTRLSWDKVLFIMSCWWILQCPVTKYCDGGQDPLSIFAIHSEHGELGIPIKVNLL